MQLTPIFSLTKKTDHQLSMSILKLLNSRYIGTSSTTVAYRIERMFIRKELVAMIEREWFFDHPKINLLCQELISHCETCKQCCLSKYVLTVLSQSEYDYDSEIRSVVLLCKTAFKRMHDENTKICKEIENMQNLVEQIIDEQHH